MAVGVRKAAIRRINLNRKTETGHRVIVNRKVTASHKAIEIISSKGIEITSKAATGIIKAAIETGLKGTEINHKGINLKTKHLKHLLIVNN